MAGGEDEHRGVRRASDWLRLVAPLALAALFLVAAWKLGFFRRGSRAVMREVEQITGRRWLAPAFVAVYALLCAFGLPVTMLAYFAGAAFGFVRGSLYIWIASMLGGTAAFYLAKGVLAKLAAKVVEPVQDKL